MRILGFEITRRRPTDLVERQYWSYPSHGQGSGGWYPLVHEPYTGAWQRNDECYRTDGVLSNATVFRCVNLIANSIAKMELRLVQKTDGGVWEEVTTPNPFSPVLRQPNSYQNHIQFIQGWVSSLQIWGNTYALKQRDQRNVVSALYLLNPSRVRPLVAPNGEVFYELGNDDLSTVDNQTRVPASEIIHDRINAIYHPLCGLSPIHAAGLAAMQGLRMQSHSERFFANGANPGGLLSAPGNMSKDEAARLKEQFQQQYSGANVGRLMVAGNGLKYEKLTMSAGDAQLIEQLKWTSENICSAFGVPTYKVGVSPAPAYNNIEALERQYYADCLQILIEQIEAALDIGLELPKPYGTEFNRDDLLGMDQRTMAETIRVAVSAGVLKPNEGRKKLNYGPVEGGDTPYLQQQNYSLSALNKRDQKADPFSRGANAPAPAPPLTPAPTPGGRQLLLNAIAAKRLLRIEARAGHP
jgi:HK97 family phage portal protein